MTEPGETEGMSAAEHLETLYRHDCGDLVGVIIINRDGEIPESILARYALEGSVPVVANLHNLSRWNLEVVQASLLYGGQLAHHDGSKLARIILDKLQGDRKQMAKQGNRACLTIQLNIQNFTGGNKS